MFGLDRRLLVALMALTMGRAAHAQAVPEPPPVWVPVVVPARLLAPVQPEYPDAARADGLVGRVMVEVNVDPDGVVVDVIFREGGPEVFVASALAAAAELRFAPATRDGVPVDSQVLVHFDFAPPSAPAEDFRLGEVPSAEVVVYGERSVAETETHAVTTLSVEALERSSGDDLGETLGQVAGVTTARGNADASKPIIRGQVERRLLVLFDGVRHASQKWGADHATEIDPFSAGEIQVIKGAAGVRYGPDAVGGVVLVDPPSLRSAPGVGGKVQVAAFSNGRRGVAAARVDGAAEAIPGFGWRVEGNYARGAALSAPDYVLGNTGSEEWNAGASMGLARDRFTLETSYRHFYLRSGVCYCVRSGTPDAFLAQLDADQPVSADLWTTSYAIDRPFQAVSHDVVMARSTIDLGGGGGALTATYAFQVNLREEYDTARESITGPQYRFTLRTHSLDVLAAHGRTNLRSGAWLEGGVGVAGTFQENVYSGLPLIPNFRAFEGGVYAYERLGVGPVEVEVGARYDHLARTAYLTPSAFERSVARETLAEDDCTVDDTAAACAARYDAGTASVGARWQVVPESLEARLDLSSATRFPNADELYMNGSAPTYPVYAIGDPGLGPETTWGASPTLGLNLGWIEAEASTYLNYIDDYVYFAPELAADGSPVVDVTIQGAFPRFAFRPIDAVFYGADGGFTLAPSAPVRLRVQGALVRAVDAATGSGLVMVPADQIGVTLHGTIPVLGPVGSPFLEVTGRETFAQTHSDLRAEIAPPPDANFLLDAALGGALAVGKRTLKISVEATNILNTRYRDYSSLLRYYADEPGRDFRLRLAMDF